MDVKRAAEVIDSLGVINVKLNGNSVWIENIDREGNKALVRDLETDKKSMVDVFELKED